MPGFSVTGYTDAPAEEVWKLLFDPTRFPEWWRGIETVQPAGDGAFVMWPDGYPDFPMPQKLRTDHSHGRVTVSCQISDIDVTWQLAEHGDGTAIEVRVELPDTEAHRLAGQRDTIRDSLAALAALAESTA